MHREISHSDSTFASESPLPLYVFTGLLAFFLGLDLYPKLAAALGWAVPWRSDALGFGFAWVAAVLGGFKIVYGTIQGLRDGKVGADLALSIAALAAIAMNEPLVAAEVVFIALVGECLEAFTFARTQKAIHKIVEVFPIRCWRLEEGKEVRVLTRDLNAGDRVVVKPGAKVPVDGVVRDGRSAVDVSPLTGESMPIDKGPGDEVLAGSLNQFGALTIEATKVAQQTVAGRVIELTERALKDKTSGERLADQMARYFLPMVLGLALATFVVAFVYFRIKTPTMSLRPLLIASAYPTLAVLVVACPCALILATPAAVMAALARLAGTGVLIKSGRALEQLALVNAIAIDKTGTLTEGKFVVRGVHPLPGVEGDDLLRLAATAEQPSEHPLGRVVVDEAKRRGFALDAVTHFQAFPGAGIVTDVSQTSVLVGNRRLLQERGIEWPADADAIAAAIDADGQTPLWAASNGKLLGAIGVQDHPRPEAAGVLDEFRQLGIDEIVLLTGDRRAAAEAVGRDLQITSIAGELLPDDKAKRVAAMKRAGSKVAMIGDGINDAPALASADVGLAISGVDLAAEAGDVVLLGDPLRHLPLLFRLARQTVRIIRQNIIWFAFVVNFLGIVLTSWLWPLFAPLDQSPLAAVIYHQIGSLLVLLNSMRLLWFERSPTRGAMAAVDRKAQAVDLWIDHTFDVHEWSHVLATHGRKIVAGLAVLLLVVYAASGLTIVKPDEVAVVRRFGRAVETLEPGWHWRYPWPIEATTRVSTRIRTVEIGFREAPGNVGAASWTWTSAHRKEYSKQDEALMMTGDGNLVDVQAVLRYKVVDPKTWLFESAEADEILRAGAEATLRGLVASKPFQELLTVKREALQNEVLERLRKSYSDKTLGVEIEGLSLLDLHPPREVVDAYYRVAEAMQQRDQVVNLEQARAIKKRKEAEADAQRILDKARAAAAEKTHAAAGESLRFVERSKARRSLTEQQEMDLALDGTEMALRGVADVEKRLADKRRQLIDAQVALSDFRTFWDAVGDVLSKRSLILVDSDSVRGQRNLYLVDPELLRPSVLFPGRMPPTRPE